MIVPIILGLIVFIVIMFVTWYRIVPQSEAHSVVTPTHSFVASPDNNISTNNKRSYFAIPSFIPFIGRVIRRMDITIKELIGCMETYEKQQARYNVSYSLKYRIKDVVTAAETFDTDHTLKEQLIEVIRSSVRAVTVKYDVIDARANKKLMSQEIQKEMDDDLRRWGIELVSFQLVDFKDTPESTIISDISKRREVAIASRTRQENAEKTKEARVKEAESEEIAKKREIEKEEKVAMAEEDKKQAIAKQQKIAEEERYKVVRVQEIEQAEINKDKAKVIAEQNREVESINKERKKLEGEGERLKLEEEAKGNAATIRENGNAEAEAKEKLQAALNKFKDNAITALTAELVVNKDKEIGIAAAKALEKADLRILSGGDNSGLDLGKMIESISLTGESNGQAFKNRLARPNDLGFTGLAAKHLEDQTKNKKGSDENIFKDKKNYFKGPK